MSLGKERGGIIGGKGGGVGGGMIGGLGVFVIGDGVNRKDAVSKIAIELIFLILFGF